MHRIFFIAPPLFHQLSSCIGHGLWLARKRFETEQLGNNIMVSGTMASILLTISGNVNVMKRLTKNGIRVSKPIIFFICINHKEGK
jgi:hypothetical protein